MTKGMCATLLLVLMLAIGGVSATTPAMTSAQRTALKAAIQGSGDTNALCAVGDMSGLAALLNADQVPTRWVWRANVTREEIYTLQNDLPVSGAQTGFWNWTTFKNQGATEQTAWREMFMGDLANFGRPNVRDGVASIFTGSAAANAQRDHVLAIGRRPATRIEHVFAVGTGSTAVPATLVITGPVDFTELVGLCP